MLKFCKEVPAMTHMISVVTHCMPAIINFSAVFLIIFAGMAFAHLLAYGDTIAQFKDTTASFYSMYRVLAGDFDFISMYKNNRIIGPAFFIIWSLVGLTVLFNMFVSIIMESYEATKVQGAPDVVEMLAEQVMKPLTDMMSKMMQRFKQPVDLGIDAPANAFDAADVQPERAEDYDADYGAGRLRRAKNQKQKAEVCRVSGWWKRWLNVDSG
jgi:hypothetical protein